MEKKQYDDIIFLEHPTSQKHPRMSIQNRAAQFAPFAALNGYEEAVNEMARLTQTKIELDEDSKEILDWKMAWLVRHQQERVKVTITHFVADVKKEGGSYQKTTGIIKKIDSFKEKLVLESGESIFIADIIEIQCDDWKEEEFS